MMDYCALGLTVGVILAGMGLAVQAGSVTVAWICLIRSWLRRSPFVDKFGRQMLGLSMVAFLGAVVCIALVAGLGYVGYNIHIDKLVFTLPWITFSWPLGGLGIGLVFTLLVAKTWRPLKKRKGVQAALLFPGWAGLWVGMYVGLNEAFLGFFSQSKPAQLPALDILWKAPLCPVWVLIAGQALIVGLAGAGTFGLSYLFARRQTEDYGRDYYRFALPLAAKWAALLLGQAFFLAWVLDRQAPELGRLPREDLISLGVAVGGFVLYGILLIVFVRSANPLRAKVSALGSTVAGTGAAVAAGLSQIWLLGV